MSKKLLTDLDFNKNEAQNLALQNVAGTPSSPVAGQIWYNSSDGYVYFYNGTSAQKVGYLSIATTSTLGGVIVGTNIAIAADGTISVANASTSGKGVIEIATDSEATAGTSTSLAITPKQLADKISGLIKLTDISANAPITFDNTTGKISATVDSTVTSGSSNLISSGAVSSAIASALTGALIYQGTWNATGQTDYSSITLPVKKGYMYAVSGSATIDGVEWNAGDYLVINTNVATGETITSAVVDKIDNTEGSDIVRLNSTQTVTNKTISASNNTISNLGTSNFASGVVQTSVRDSSSSSNTAIATEKAVRSAINAAVTSMAKKATATNPALTTTGGICTWNITNNLGDDAIISIKEISSGAEVYCDITYGTGVITVKINSANNISQGVYKATIIA